MNKSNKLLTKARKMPVIFDEDSPEMNEEMEKAFVAARKKKPYRGELLTLYISDIKQAGSLKDLLLVLRKYCQLWHRLHALFNS